MDSAVNINTNGDDGIDPSDDEGLLLGIDR